MLKVGKGGIINKDETLENLENTGETCRIRAIKSCANGRFT